VQITISFSRHKERKRERERWRNGGNDEGVSLRERRNVFYGGRRLFFENIMEREEHGNKHTHIYTREGGKT